MQVSTQWPSPTRAEDGSSLMMALESMSLSIRKPMLGSSWAPWGTKPSAALSSKTRRISSKLKSSMAKWRKSTFLLIQTLRLLWRFHQPGWQVCFQVLWHLLWIPQLRWSQVLGWQAHPRSQNQTGGEALGIWLQEQIRSHQAEGRQNHWSPSWKREDLRNAEKGCQTETTVQKQMNVCIFIHSLNINAKIKVIYFLQNTSWTLSCGDVGPWCDGFSDLLILLVWTHSEKI